MLKILRIGSTGPEVEKWQTFLRGLIPDSHVVVNGDFDLITESETKSFQNRKGLIADGMVGPKTIAVALQAGYPLMDDPTGDVNGPNWPPSPVTGPLGFADREKLFGKFSYTPAPTSGNPEGISIIGDWAKKNISTVNLSQLNGIPGFPKSCNVTIHAALSAQFKDLFDAWHSEGLTYLIMTWGGTWAPRFIRGSRTTLSNHAWATAFDINVQWNQLGVQPALRGAVGSVRELVDIAYQHGFYWGGWFANTPDGMHFEAYKIL